MSAEHRRKLANGRSDSRRKTGKRGKIEGPFVQIRQDMLESPAFRALSSSAMRILHRLEIEHMAHAGTENGNLICTYQDFADYGVSMGAIKAALSQLAALGFIEIAVKGRRSSGGVKIPSRYRLTYLPENGVDAKPTDEWAGKDEQAVADAIERLDTKRKSKQVENRDARSLRRHEGALARVPPVEIKQAGGSR
jgi:hypothetical protein